jgi:hypothetical protein
MKTFNILTLVLLCLSTVAISKKLKSNVKTTDISYDVSALHGFRCFDLTGIQTPVRLNKKGDIECFSIDGRKCIWGITTLDQCKQIIANRIGKLKPLACGLPLFALYG